MGFVYSISKVVEKNLILNRKSNSGSKVNLGSISKGNYIIQVKDKTGRLLSSQRLVKEQTLYFLPLLTYLIKWISRTSKFQEAPKNCAPFCAP